MGEPIQYTGETLVERASRLLSSQMPEGANEQRIITERRTVINAEVAEGANEQWQKREFAFNGAMILDSDPLNIGLNNYSDLQNLRYVNVGLEGVQGYTQINATTALTNTNLRSGLQLINRKGGTLASHVLVQAYNAGFTSASVYLNTTAIPNQGDFDGTPLHTDASGAGLGRFSHGPDGSIIYCNGEESLIWSSDEHRVAAVVNYEDSDLDGFRYLVENRLSNNQTDAINTWVLVLDAGQAFLLIGSTRPLQGIKFYVETANTTASTSTVEYWDGSAWAGVSGFSDGTASGGVTLAQTGSMTFTSTVTTARTQIQDGRLLYYYRVIVGATGSPDATIELSQITVDPPFQPIIDIWDGVERNPIGFFLINSGDNQDLDYTLEIQEPSYSTAPIDVDISLYLSPNDPMLIGFEERMTAIRFEITPNQFNNDSSTSDVEYWDGTGWVSVDGLVDGTSKSGASFAHNGLISWSAPDPAEEKAKEEYGIQAYWYRVYPGDIRETPSTHVDYVSGIPAQRFDGTRPMPGYKFPMFYRGRHFLCGALEESEGNRMDYCAIGAPDVYNGDDSSALGQSIYVGDQEDLTAGIELFNRHGDVISVQAVITKARQTWLLVGASPADFQLFSVSDTIGCPCPLTMDRADVAFSVDTQAVRNIAIWVSYQGPMIFDGGILSPMRFLQPDGSISSVDPYFDPNDSRYITVSALENARGWFDATFAEYNILLPTAGSTTCNVWLVCDLRRRKWFRKVPTTYPQMGFRVVDANGGQYVYAGLDSGRMMRLENSNSWDGMNITHIVDTSDMIVSGSLWDETQIRFVRASVVTETGDADSMTLGHSPNGATSFTTIATLAVTSGGSDRYRRVTQAVGLTAWSHQFRLTLASDNKAVAPRLINWGFLYNIERTENYDSIDNTVGQGSTGP